MTNLSVLVKNHKKYTKELVSLSSDDWNLISMHHKLSKEFMIKFNNRMVWSTACIFQKLDEELLSKCRVDWKAVSRHQTLSENTIRKFKNRVDWVSIAAYQQVSDDFKKEFKDFVLWK